MKELLPITIKDISNPKKYEVNKAKTLWAFLFVGIGWFLNELSLAWIHDRVPRNVEPLPDLWFDWFPEIRSAIQITEYIMIFMTVNSLVIVICHQHRWIVARRVFFCAALAYIFRSLCITVIQMPVPSVNTYCAPQGNGSFTSIAARVRKIFWSAGIEQLRPRELCGDLIVSGHTITLFTAMMAFRQYCPRRLTIVGYFYNILAFAGLIAILFARKHYTIDIILGYFVTTRIFWTYHSLAYSYHQGDLDRNPLSQSCWTFIVKFFESDAPREFLNVLEWPSSCPSKIRRHLSM